MTNEQMLRELSDKLQGFGRSIAAERQRLTALLKGPEAPQLRALLAQRPGLGELLTAFDGLGKCPDPSTTTVYDRIRADVAHRQGQQAAPKSIEERLRLT